MSIRLKIFLCLVLTVGLIWGSTAYVASTVFLERFEELDSQRLGRAVNRVLEGIKEEQKLIRAATSQWMISRPETMDRTESARGFLAEFDLNLLVLVGRNGSIERTAWFEFAADSLSTSDAAQFAELVLTNPDAANGIPGVVQTSHGPFLSAAVTNRLTGGEEAGAVAGVFLDERYEQSLRNLMLTDLQFLPPTGQEMELFRGNTESIPTAIPRPSSEADTISGYALIRDVNGNPALMLKLTDSRHSFLEGTTNLRFFLGVTGAGAIASVLIGTFFVEWLVSGRLRRLTNSARRADINGMDDLPKSFSRGKDEVSVLARVTKSMVESLKSSQVLYRAVVETQKELILRYKPDGEITLANEAFAKLFGRHPKTVVGKNLKEFLSPEVIDGEDILENLPNATHRSNNRDLKLIMEGNVRWIHWNQRAVLNDDHEVTEIQASGSDFTLHRDYEMKLEDARQAAEAADRSKSEFLSIMSHETRTPLTGILGFTSVLESTPLTDNQREYLSLIRASSNSLLMLLNDVLDYSNVASGRIKLNLQTFRVATLAREIIAIHTPEAREKGVDLEVDIEPETPEAIETDMGRLRQVLHNLVDNGLKFTERGFVRLSLAPDGEGKIRFTVQDTGIGIAKESLEKIFEAFGMNNSSNSRGHGGAGIGLAVCRKVMDLLGGTISVRSEEGIGSRFTITLPVGHPSPLLEPDAAISSEDGVERPDFSGYGIRALVVDDNLVNQKVIARMLGLIGVETEVASNGRECLEITSRSYFPLIFMDIQMPEMDGFEAVSRIRDSEEGHKQDSYIVACTAFDLPGDRERCLASGMNDFVSKPVQVKSLIRVIQDFISETKLGDPGNLARSSLSS